MSEGVAIVGMSCRFAGAPDVPSFWRNVLSRERFFSAPQDPASARFVDPESNAFERVPTLRAGYLGDLWDYAPAHGASDCPRGTDPAEILAMDLVASALHDAGIPDRPFARDRAIAVFGASRALNPANVGWMQLGIALDQTIDVVRQCFPGASPASVAALRESLRANVPDIDARAAQSLLPDSLSTRISARFDMRGGHFSIDAGSASALVALQSASDELLAGRSDIAVVGAVQQAMLPQLFMPLAHLGILSRLDAPLPFGAAADGMLPGEGGAVFVLKRAEEAEEDGDRVYAILRGFGVASEGRSANVRSGPDESTHLRALERAYSAAGGRPEAGLIEAHACGMPLWDRAEAYALASLFGAREGGWPSIALGSVKGQIGHTGIAAAAAGVVKSALALHFRILPPSPDCGEPQPAIHLDETPFYLATEARPWAHHGLRPRRAGVSSITLGGLHAHAVLEEQGADR